LTQKWFDRGRRPHRLVKKIPWPDAGRASWWPCAAASSPPPPQPHTSCG